MKNRLALLMALAAMSPPGLAMAQSDALLRGAAYGASDLAPLGPGLTTLQFIPGRGLVRSSPSTPAAKRGPVDPIPVADRYADIRLNGPHRLSRRAEVMRALGIGDERRFGAEPRWLIFAASGGRALGYSRLQAGQGGGGWALERGGFFGRAQVGLAWRRGDYQSSISYVRDEIDIDLFGAEDIDEDRGALTLTRFLGDPHRSRRGVFGGGQALAPPAE
jgi:hypothetical protein